VEQLKHVIRIGGQGSQVPPIQSMLAYTVCADEQIESMEPSTPCPLDRLIVLRFETHSQPFRIPMVL
jgi:hypothetical protein